MTKQLRLVDTPRARRSGSGRRAARWPDWRLDDRTRRIGHAGVAAARAELERARRPRPDEPLRKAS